MEIRKTKIEELDTVLAIYERARNFMAANGNPNQWGKKSPSDEQVEADIRAGRSYVCMEGEEIAGVFYYAFENDPTYAKIYDGEWLSDEPYGVVHRVASAGIVPGMGSTCLNWAFEQCHNVRIDTHEENIPMQNLLKKLGFTYCGIIYLQNGSKRLAFQKEEAK